MHVIVLSCSCCFRPRIIACHRSQSETRFQSSRLTVRPGQIREIVKQSERQRSDAMFWYAPHQTITLLAVSERTTLSSRSRLLRLGMDVLAQQSSRVRCIAPSKWLRRQRMRSQRRGNRNAEAMAYRVAIHLRARSIPFTRCFVRICNCDSTPSTERKRLSCRPPAENGLQTNNTIIDRGRRRSTAAGG